MCAETFFLLAKNFHLHGRVISGIAFYLMCDSILSRPVVAVKALVPAFYQIWSNKGTGIQKLSVFGPAIV